MTSPDVPSDVQTRNGTYVLQNKRNSATALMDQYELANLTSDVTYGATWRLHSPHPPCYNHSDSVETQSSRLTVATAGSRNPSVSEGGVHRAPDVISGKTRNPHVYEAPMFIPKRSVSPIPTDDNGWWRHYGRAVTPGEDPQQRVREGRPDG